MFAVAKQHCIQLSCCTVYIDSLKNALLYTGVNDIS